MTTDKIENLITHFAAELRATLTEEIMRDVNGRVAAAINGNGVIAKMDKRIGNTQKRSREDIEDTKARILAALKEEPGMRSEQLQRTLKLKAENLQLPIKELLSAKQIKSEGVARGRKYTAR